MESESWRSSELDYAVNASFRGARQKKHEYLTVEHLLLALLLHAGSLDELWRDLRVDKFQFVNQLSEHIDLVTPRLEGDAQVQPTIGFQRCLQRAVFHVQAAGGKAVEPADVLIAILSERKSDAYNALLEHGLSRQFVVDYFAPGGRQIAAASIARVRAPEETFAQQLEQIAAVNLQKPAKSLLQVFISYSHADEACLNRLLVHLRPLEKAGTIDCWSDKRIRTGEKWRQQIRQSIEKARIAILMVSADFLASQFIVEHELPPLLVAAEGRGMRIIPVLLKPCGFHRDAVLSTFQTINDPAEPLMGLDNIKQEALYNRIADQVAEEARSGEYDRLRMYEAPP